MASLKDARGFADELHGLSGRLQSELEKSSVDFERLVELSDEIGESADRLASTFNAINGSLAGLIENREPGEGEGGDSGTGAEEQEAAAQKGSRQRRTRGARGPVGQGRPKKE